MLKNLRVSNIALIENLDLDLYPGFSVLTGETGAGKSIIIEALNFVLGERASRELIMSGKQKASVEACFLLGPKDPVYPVLKEYEIESENDELILYRELSAAGKNVCRVSGVPVSTAILKSVGDALVDIHGQHAHQQLLDPKQHLYMLDNFAGEDAATLRKEVGLAYSKLREAERLLKSAVMDARERERRCDLLSYQIKEIEDANLIPGEEEELQENRKKLQNAQSIMEALDAGAEGLSGEEGALGILSGAMRALEGISQYSEEYQDIVKRFQEAYYTLEDVSDGVSHLKNSFSYEPESLDQMEWRLETIATLKRKYGDSVENILQYLSNIRQEYEFLSESEARHDQLEQDCAHLKTEYLNHARRLSDLRLKAGKALEEKLLPELSDLGMPHTAFEVHQETGDDHATSLGIDDVEFLLSTNMGEPVKPLSKVASGGEISRIMLGFKSVLAGSGGVMTMVFDEIDTGISGRVGTAVAEKMREIASTHQVMSITHLAQIASYADHQYFVHKETVEGRTFSTATLLTDAERVKEIARIMGSNPDDEIALEHARKLLSSAPKRT